MKVGIQILIKMTGLCIKYGMTTPQITCYRVLVDEYQAVVVRALAGRPDDLYWKADLFDR